MNQHTENKAQRGQDDVQHSTSKSHAMYADCCTPSSCCFLLAPTLEQSRGLPLLLGDMALREVHGVKQATDWQWTD